ncbi:MAG: RsmB/NOP family class I SAM-dependent RNA methyltransferase [Pseudomonadota bacterium]
MSETAAPARKAAIHLLNGVLIDHRQLTEMIEKGALDRYSPQDRARGQRLAVDVLRGLERADRLLDRFLRKRPQLNIRNILRLGTVELCQGGAAHGVVADMVALAGGHHKDKQLRGMINAVLRRVAEDGVGPWKDLRIPRLPKWLRDPLVSAWGAGAVSGMEKAHFQGAALDITVKEDEAHWAERLGGTLLPTGSIRLENPGQISALPGYEDGAWWIQDAAAALPVQLLNPQAGEVVLDLCAAPGGKTLQLAAGGAEVTALDISDRRMARVRENLERTKLKANCIVEDALKHKGSYDAILLDAPCSATGTIRRHPDLPFAKDGSEFSDLIALQSKMLDHAVTLLKPGGRLVFCTCSLLPDEGEVQVEEALVRHEGLVAERASLGLSGVEPEWVTEEGGLRLRPDYWAGQGGMDGFYMAVLRKA